MLRHPIWTIFSLMVASIVVAASYQTWRLSRLDPERPGLFSSWSRLVARAKSTMAATESDCSRDRLYIETLTRNLPPIFREARWRKSHDLPSQCVLTSLVDHSVVQPNLNYTWCSDEGLFGAKPPCVTELFVNVIDNAISDITDCFDLSAREFLAIASARSVLPLSSWDEIKLHPLSGPTLGPIEDLTKGSCQRAKALAELEIPVKDSTTCGGLEKPFRSLVELGQHLQQLQKDFEIQWAQDMESMTDLSIPEEQRDWLQAWAFLLASEIGPPAAVGLVKDFLTSLKPERGLSSETDMAGQALPDGNFKVFLSERHPVAEKFYRDLEDWSRNMRSRGLHAQCVPGPLTIQ